MERISDSCLASYHQLTLEIDGYVTRSVLFPNVVHCAPLWFACVTRSTVEQCRAKRVSGTP